MRIAVIGSGVSGLAASWLLNEHSEHEVHLFEKDNRAGGHVNTVPFRPTVGDPKSCVHVDTGYVVLNPAAYPNFLSFLRLQSPTAVPLIPTDMTLSVSRNNGALEWSGISIVSVFCQPKRLLDPKIWRMLYDVLRFNANARMLAKLWRRQGSSTDDVVEMLPLGRYLQRQGYSQSFADNYLIPMIAAIWSTPPDICANDFPIRSLLPFMENHDLLRISGKPKWLTIRGGSNKYVKQILSKLSPSQLHLSATVAAVWRADDGRVRVRLESGHEETFDKVILACHSDQALHILGAGGGATEAQEKTLGAFRWTENKAVLHSDTKLMPKSRGAWTCWNFITYSSFDETGNRKPHQDKVSLSYGVNFLQSIPISQAGPIFLTVNPPEQPSPDLTQGEYTYSHPVLDHSAVQAQERMPSIQGERSIFYAGAWMGYGFHEDGFTSGLLAALAVDDSIKVPFEIKPVKDTSWDRDRVRKDSDTSLREMSDDLGMKTLVGLFWLLEATGARWIAGILFGTILRVLAMFLCVSV